METVLENGPPIGWHTLPSGDLICQRYQPMPVPTFPQVPTFPPHD